MRQTRLIIFCAVSLAAVVVAVVAAYQHSQARIEGSTALEKIASIAKITDERPISSADVLAKAARNDLDKEVRRAAMLALGRMPGKTARAAAEAGIADPEPEVRSAAAATLGVFKDDPAAEQLGKLAADDPDEEVRLSAVEALHQCGTVRSGEVLLPVARSDKPGRVRDKAFVLMMDMVMVHWPKGAEPWDVTRWDALRVAGDQLLASRRTTLPSHDGMNPATQPKEWQK